MPGGRGSKQYALFSGRVSKSPKIYLLKSCPEERSAIHGIRRLLLYLFLFILFCLALFLVIRRFFMRQTFWTHALFSAVQAPFSSWRGLGVIIRLSSF